VSEAIKEMLKRYLFPADEDRVPGFRKELNRISVLGLRVIGVLCLMWSLTILLMAATWLPEIPVTFGLGHSILILTIGLVALALSFLPLPGTARTLGLFVGYSIAAAEIAGAMRVGLHPLELEHFIPRVVIMVLLVVLAAIPLKPVHTLLLGISITMSYLGMFLWRVSTEPGPALYVSLIILANVSLMATALTAVVYHWRAQSFRARRAAEDALEELRQAQSELVISVNAASQLRFAAAMSHELNTPLGTLGSSLDTTMLALDKWREQPEDRERFEGVVRDASRAGRQSLNRLKNTVDRMKHLTNLDRAENQHVDLNELWIDTVAHLQHELDPKADVRMQFMPLPQVEVRPQQMSTVFSNLLRNAVAALDAQGTIHIRSSRQRDTIILEVEDNGRGIPSDKLEHLFDLDFQVKGGIVSTTNWGLFVSRSIIAEHGGRLELESTEGKGTLARIRLPVSS
jgi:signal transduction histidine kinase